MSASGTLCGGGLNVGNGAVMLPRLASRSTMSVRLVIERRFRAWRCRRTRKIASRAIKKPNEPKTAAIIAAVPVDPGGPPPGGPSRGAVEEGVVPTGGA